MLSSIRTCWWQDCLRIVIKPKEINIDKSFQRLSESELRLENSFGVDVKVFANESVPIENTAVEELHEMLELQATIEEFNQRQPESFPESPGILSVAITPDFHKARGIPVGTTLQTRGCIIPQAIGNDINCGMRLHLTDLDAAEVENNAGLVEATLRNIFFEGGRRIPMTWDHRHALLTNGVKGLADITQSRFDEGSWSYFHRIDWDTELNRIDRSGSIAATEIEAPKDLLGDKDNLSRDSQIGSIGGGNHFVEIQKVEKVINGQTAHAWGLKPGTVTIMVHTGSLSVGQSCGSRYQDLVREIFPADLKHPSNGIFVLPTGEKHRATSERFWNGLANAANFAFANRMFLALMAWEGLEKILGEFKVSLLYDAPHNMLWRENHQGEETVIHRKGACPARGYASMQGTEFEYYGEPVLVPGSMGASSFVLAGRGNEKSIQSAAHGAGRAVPRGAAMKGHEREFDEFLQNFRVVTPLDLNRPEVRQRKDIVDKKLAELKQEAPFAYKGIGPVIETLEDAEIAEPVVELRPIMTIKG